MPNPENTIVDYASRFDAAMPMLTVAFALLIIAGVASRAFFAYHRKRHSYYTPERLRTIARDRIPGNYTKL